ncbi:hypothetical protein GLYMA_01G045750v4 [Glycine max]|nr:hypothetical protein GLYMA_01G045750v4 [Glycine max]KAH1161600.1 hypothetical protein GYH30_000477 [Glycine max]
MNNIIIIIIFLFSCFSFTVASRSHCCHRSTHLNLVISGIAIRAHCFRNGLLWMILAKTNKTRLSKWGKDNH